MTTAIKRRRGTTTQHATFTGLEGELTVDTTKDTVVVHDGATAGGFPLAKESQATTNVAITGGTITGITDIAIADGGTGASTAADARTNLGVTATGADTTYAYRANNLSDLASASTARSNLGLGTISTQAASSVAITGGTINGTAIGASTASTGAFTTLAYSSTLTGGTGVINIGSGQFYKDASGNVGIGTSSPTQKLTVFDTTNTTDYQMAIGNVAGGSYNIGREFSTGLMKFYGTQSGFTGYVFSGVDGERMRIDSSGNLLVGTTSATSRTGVTARTVSFTTSQDAIYATVNNNSFFTINSHVRTTSGTRYHIGFGDGATWAERGFISTNGTSTTYSTTSDYRLKDNVAPMTGALAKVKALKPCTYTWKADGSAGEGFIAHELQAVVPNAVTGEKDGEKMQGIDTSFLVATLTAAIQEQQALIENLTTRLNALEGN